LNRGRARLAAVAAGARDAEKKFVVEAENLARRVPHRDAMLHWSCRYFGAGVSSSAVSIDRRRRLRR
jgi:hypothetical protein